MRALRLVALGPLAALLASACSTENPSESPDLAIPSDLASGTDRTPPTFSGITRAMPAGPTLINIDWSAATDAVTPKAQLTYLIYRATTSGGQNFGQPTYTSDPGATTFAATGLTANTRYYFVVRARDAAGNVDANRSELSALTPQVTDTQPPTFAGVVGSSVTGNTVTLTWAAGSDNQTPPGQLVYQIYAAKTSGGQNFMTSAFTTPPGFTQFTVSGLDARTQYFFVVRAQDLSGNRDANVIEKSDTTGDISYAGQVAPIFTGYCTGAACHSGAMPQEGLNLTNAAIAYTNLVNRASSRCPTDPRVLPTKPDQSYLYWKLLGMSIGGGCYQGVRMPPGGQVTNGELNTIRGWIAAGAPNN